MKVTLTREEVASIVLQHLANEFPRANLNRVEISHGYYNADYCTVTHDEQPQEQPQREEVDL